MRRPFVAAGTVRYVGQPVVAIVAEDRAQRRRCRRSRRHRLRAAACRRRPGGGGARRGAAVPRRRLQRGDAVRPPRRQADFSACEVVVAERIVNQRMTAAPIEGRSGAAYWTADGRLVHYSACQGAHPTRDLLAQVYGLEPAQVRVIVPDVGGGFGAKSRTYSRGAGPRLLRPRAGAAGAMDGDTLGEHGRDAPRPGPGAVRHARRHAGRADHRLPARHRAGCRRLPDGRRAPADGDRAHDDGRLRPPQRRLQRRLDGHQHRVDDGVPRSRPPGGGRRHRAHGRPLRRRDRDGPRRGAAAQLRPPLHRAVHDRRRHARTTSGTTGSRSSGPCWRPATTSCAPSRSRRRADEDPIALGIGIATYVEITAGVPGAEFGVRRGARATAGCSCAAGPRRTARATTRPGR